MRRGETISDQIDDLASDAYLALRKLIDSKDSKLADLLLPLVAYCYKEGFEEAEILCNKMKLEYDHAIAVLAQNSPSIWMNECKEHLYMSA